MIDFNKVETHTQDLPLFKELGLKPFSTTCMVKQLVGRVTVGNSDVLIRVTGLPAQFWEISIICKSGRMYQVLTGSGCLVDYWGTVKLLAEGRLVVKEEHIKGVA